MATTCPLHRRGNVTPGKWGHRGTVMRLGVDPDGDSRGCSLPTRLYCLWASGSIVFTCSFLFQSSTAGVEKKRKSGGQELPSQSRKGPGCTPALPMHISGSLRGCLWQLATLVPVATLI